MFFLVQLANVEVRQPHEQANKIENKGPIIVCLLRTALVAPSTFTPALPNLQLLLLLVRESFMRQRSVTVGQKPCGTLLQDTLVGHSCKTLTLVGHSCGTLLSDTLVGHSFVGLPSGTVPRKRTSHPGRANPDGTATSRT